MWIIGLYLLLGLMTWVVYDNAAKEMNVEKSDAKGMVMLIGLWPLYWWAWFTTREHDHGPE